MRIPFLAGGRSPDDDPERRKLLVAEGRVPRPFPGPWTLRAVVRGEGSAEAPAASTSEEPHPDETGPGGGSRGEGPGSGVPPSPTPAHRPGSDTAP